MRLDHINLTVSNVTEVSSFFKKNFGFTDAFEDNNAGMAVLSGDDGMHINLMKGSRISYPKMFHIGFDARTESKVNEIFERLKAAGLEMKPPEHTWGSWTFHFECPGGNFMIEVACEKV